MVKGIKTKSELLSEIERLQRRISSLEKESTEQKKTIEALKDAAYSWRKTFDSANPMIMLVDSDLRIKRANLATIKFLGISFEEIVGKTCFKLFCKTDKPVEQCPLVMAKQTKRHEESELYLPEKDLWILATADPILDDKGDTVEVVYTVYDITERKLTEEEIKRNHDTQNVINLLLRLSLEDIPLEDILKRALDLILSISWIVFQARGSIFLVEDDLDILVMKAQHGIAEPIQRSCAKVSFGRCLCGQAALEQKIEFADRIDERHETSYEGIIPHGHYCVPILFAGKTLGVINIYLKEGHHRSEREEEFMNAVANTLAGIIIRKRAEEKLAMLYQEVKSEAEVSKSLLQMFETLNISLDERELIRNVINIAPKYLKFERVGFFLYSEDLKGFVFSGGHGLSHIEERMLMAMTFRVGDFPAIDKVMKGETVIIENARESGLISKELFDTLNIGSAILIPISFRGKVSGIVYGDYKTIRPIESRDIALLKGLADGMAIALENSRLYKESVERLMELSNKVEILNTISKLDREILSTLDRNTILRTATALISRIIPCERTAVLLKDDDRYRVTSEWGIGEFQDMACDIKNTSFEVIERLRGPLFIQDHSQDSTDCPYCKKLYAIGIKSSIIIPLISKEEVIGILDIGSTSSGNLTPAHLSTAERIAAQITVALESARLYEDLEQLLVNMITSLASAIDAKSSWTKGHSERVTRYAVEIAREIALKEKDIEHIRLCGLLHDIGKIGIYDFILEKPERLTDEEFELVKRHPVKGAEILRPIKQLSEVIKGVLYHHERYDGKGYPEGIRGEDIPLCARILAVADSFDSMTSDRPYRPSPGKEYAISELKRCTGTQYDPKIVEAFLRILGKGQLW